MLADRLRQTLSDNLPNALGFISVTSAERSTVTTSNTVTISGLGAPTAVIVTNGEYSKNAAAYTSVDGTVTNGDTLTLRHTSSSSYSTAQATTLQVGASIATWSSTTRAQDTTPTAFSFTAVTGAERSTVQTSNLITFSGVDADVVAAVTVSGGTYSKNGAAYVSSAGTASLGNTFRVQHTSSASFTTAINTILTIGATSATFTSTTRALDTTPTAFSFTAVTGASVSTLYTSNTITLAGLGSGDTASVGIVGGTYSKNGGGFTSASTTAVNGDTFAVQISSSSSYSTAASATLTIGGVAGSYSVTTRVADTTPSAFTFTDATGASISTVYTSNTITVAGLDTGVSTAVSISGGTYSKNGGAYTSSAGTAVNGDTFAVRATSSASYSTAASTVLSIGGVSDTYTVTTRAADTTPTAFTLIDVTGADLSITFQSNDVLVSGMDAGVPTPITITGGTYNKNGSGTFTSAPGTVVQTDVVAIRVTTAATFSTPVSATLTIGGVSDTWTVTTKAS